MLVVCLRLQNLVDFAKVFELRTEDIFLTPQFGNEAKLIEFARGLSLSWDLLFAFHFQLGAVFLRFALYVNASLSAVGCTIQKR